MNIYKKSKLRNLTNEELKKLIHELKDLDKDLLRELRERLLDGRAVREQIYILTK